MAWRDGSHPLAVGGIGGAGGSDCLVSAAILAGGSILAVADRGHQAPVDAVLELRRTVAVLGSEQAGKSISNIAAVGSAW